MGEAHVTGDLLFSEESGKFWIANEENQMTELEFGDEFEVKVGETWVKTALEIGSNEQGELIFKLKNTPYSGAINGVSARI